jgi:cytochrome c peroxidase
MKKGRSLDDLEEPHRPLGIIGFATLEEVVEFYNLSPPLRVPTPPGPPRRLNLTADQKAALIAFLRTLTDPNLSADSKLSDPFNYGN